MNFPGRLATSVLLIVFSSAVWAADPVVSNVRATQRPGTHLVEITYDLADPDSATLVGLSDEFTEKATGRAKVAAETLVAILPDSKAGTPEHAERFTPLAPVGPMNGIQKPAMAGTATAPLTFTVRAGGQDGQTVTFTSGEKHTITINVECDIRFLPGAYGCDGERFRSQLGRLQGTVRFWGVATDHARNTFHFDITKTGDFVPSNAIESSFTPGTADYLYFITREQVWIPEEEAVAYAFEYVASLGVMRVWIALPSPFVYPAEHEHYDFPASHTVAGTETAPSCLIGSVMDAATGKPIPASDIRFGNVARQADDNGRFHYERIPPGTYRLEMKQPGYEPLDSPVNIPPFQILSQTYRLTPEHPLKMISGRVVHAKTRQPLSAVTVRYAGLSETTGAGGEFEFIGPSLPRQGKMEFLKPQFSTVVHSLNVPTEFSQWVLPDTALPPLGELAVLSIEPKYDGLFLSGVSLLNEYTATVSWGGRTPGSVDFYVNGSLARTVPTSDTEATADINMTLGFLGSLTIGANKVSAVAVSEDGTRSAIFDQPVAILPVPLFLLNQGILLPFELIPGNQPALSWEFNFPRSFLSARDVKTIPFINKFGPDFNFSLAFDYEVLTGEWGLFAGKEWDKRLHYRSGVRPHSKPRHPKFYFGNVDFDWGFGGKAEGAASQTRGIAVEKVGVQLSAGVRMEILSFYFTDYVPGGQLVRLLDSLKSLGIDVNSIQRVRVDGLFDAELSAMLKLSSLAFDNATVNLQPGVEAIYEPSVGVAHGSIALGGNLGFDLQLAPRFGMDEITGSIYMKLHFEAWYMKPYDETFIILNGTLFQRPKGASLLGTTSHAAKPLLGDGQWVVVRAISDSSGLLGRDYLESGTERFAVQDGVTGTRANGAVLHARDTAPEVLSPLQAFRKVGRSALGQAVNQARPVQAHSSPPTEGDPRAGQVDLPILENVFPIGQPALAGRSNELMLLYISDPGTTPDLQRTDIRWTRWDGTNWSEPKTILADMRAEFAPQVAFDSSGDAVAVWERVADPNFNQLDLAAMAAQMEIVSSRWDRASGQWTEPQALTANAHLDHAPLLAGPLADGSVLATWTSNPQNLLMGTNGAPSQLVGSRWNPTTGSWSAPQILLASLPNRLSQSLAGAGNRAVYAWTQDLDGDFGTVSDQQAFRLEWSDGAWGAPTQFTVGTDGNRNARVAVSAAGDAFAFWQQDTNLVMSRNFGPDVRVVRADSQTAGFADYALTAGPEGNLVLLWQEMSEDGSDAHYRVYDPAADAWSRDERLFRDAPLERSFAPVWDNVGNLTVAYNKVEILHTNKTVTLEGGQTITITNVPQSGRVDLAVTKRRLVRDVALLTGDFTVEGVNYLPGDPLALAVTLRNTGDLALTNVAVAFYDGDPQADGVLLTNVAVAGWFDGASTNQVLATWVVSEPAAPHSLYAVATAKDDWDAANNTQSVRIGGTDLQVSLVSSRAETNGAVRVITQVVNWGAPTAPESVLAIRWAGDTNAPLATAPVLALEPGRLAQVALDLPAGTQPEGEVLYELRADDTAVVSDIDPANNTARFAVNLWLDADGDGMPDGWERDQGLNPNDPTDAAKDKDGDGVSNLAEYRAGTHPGDPHSYLWINSLAVGEGTGGVELRWGSVPNRLYTVLRSAAVLGGFVPVAEHVMSTPPENAWMDTTATNSTSSFYRLQVE